ncbi:MAG: alpha/beta hydrolase, partial [Anaerolineae bacterium]
RLDTVQVNGTTIAYQQAGSGECTLLLLHGAMVSHTDWTPQLSVFGAEYRLLVPDIRGHGASGRDGRPYSFAQFAADMVGLMDALGIAEAAVIGHSMGGMVAQEFALAYPHRTWALVLAETSYGIRSRWYEALLTDLTIPLIKYYSIEKQADLYARVLGKHTPQVKDYIRGEIGALADDPENVQAIWDAVGGFDAKGRLHQLQLLTLILVGEHFRQTHGQGRNMAKLIPGARFGMVAGAGHMLNWDNPEQFNSEVLTFLTGVEQRQTGTVFR